MLISFFLPAVLAITTVSLLPTEIGQIGLVRGYKKKREKEVRKPKRGFVGKTVICIAVTRCCETSTLSGGTNDEGESNVNVFSFFFFFLYYLNASE